MTYFVSVSWSISAFPLAQLLAAKFCVSFNLACLSGSLPHLWRDLVYLIAVLFTLFFSSPSDNHSCVLTHCSSELLSILFTVFSGLSRDFFFKNFRVAAYISVRLMCRRFQKSTHYTLHATACLDQHLITISAPTVLHNHWLSLQPCGHPLPCPPPLSLSVHVCVVSHSNGSQPHCSK